MNVTTTTGKGPVGVAGFPALLIESSLQTLDRLGYDPETLTRFERALSRPDGLVLVTGPTGSGKTTALYAALGHLRTGRTNIVSVEDPVERTVPGVTQIPVNVRAGNTFPAGTVHTEFEARRLGVEHHLATVPASAGPGCEHCKLTGYGGRVPIAELLTPSDELRDAIVRGATAHEIRAAMRAAGIPNMRDHALRLVAGGTTSIEEVNRVLAADVDGAQATNRTRSRVLVTDDEPITRMLVKLLLERENFEVLEAANGRQAVDIATRERPDLLIIDLSMPEMDGYEAISRLRRDITMATLPIVVLTSEEGPGIERRVLDLGADDYIVKPFDPAVLLSRVNGVFRRLKVMAA